MSATADGWHACEVAEAGPGDLYQFILPDGLAVPDPASRHQPGDVHGPSEVIDPAEFAWQDTEWRGRPWRDAVVYELHVGTFTEEGTFRAVEPHLADLAALGVTVIELMPVGDFPGTRNWGYDGVCLFAPDSTYGRPDDLKSLVAAAHSHGLMVLLDVVYNHFGPDGNYLWVSAPPFFTDRYETPWGAAIDFGGPNGRTVRDFFIENALYWLTEFHVDGLRLDAVHAIHDESHPHILTELAETVRQRLPADRHVHLVLENDANEARRLSPGRYDAQWNDDFHHVVHHMITGETSGYYIDYVDTSVELLGRALTEGFVYQGEPSAYRNGAPRGENSAALPPERFVSFLQNHDQVGNRAFGERIGALASEESVTAATVLYLLAPSPPLIFMGEEWDAREPFPYFCDFEGPLADSVREGRRQEFARFPAFRDEAARAHIPDPTDVATFRAAVLNRDHREAPRHATRLALFRTLLDLRARYIVPLLGGATPPERAYRVIGPSALTASWRFAGDAVLSCRLNLGSEAAGGVAPPDGSVLYATHDVPDGETLPPWYAGWFLKAN